MNQNPWDQPFLSQPFVLDEDKAAVQAFNKSHKLNNIYHLHIDKMLPEPFVGNKDAPVVLLSNNPGFGEEEEIRGARRTKLFMDMMRQNLRHEPTDWPFLYLNPKFRGPGKQWWKGKLRWLIDTFDRASVAKSVLNVVYFPYPSRRYKHLREPLPSQQYGFTLVKEAIQRGAVIVLMRPGKKERWLKEVEELQNYPRFFRVRNPQNPCISTNGVLDWNDNKRFDEIVNAIAKYTNMQPRRGDRE